MKHLSFKGTPLPPVLDTRFKYTSSIALSATAGSISSYAYRLNSLYDPNATGTGVQPGWFTVLCNASAYLRYVVYAADVSVQFLNTSAYATDVSITGLNSNVTVQPALAGEGSFGQSSMLAPSGGGALMKTFTAHLSTAAVWGTNQEAVMTSDYYRGTYNTNPAHMSYLILSIQASDQSSAVSVFTRVKIVYHARLTELNNVVL